MRMFSPLWHKRGFSERTVVLWRSGRSRTLHSTPIVNYTENQPLPVSWRSEVDKIDKEADIMRMFSSLWPKRGFDEKLAVFVTFWPLPHISFNSYSKLHRESTTSSQLATWSEKIEKMTDTMRMFSPKRRSRVSLVIPDWKQKWELGQQPISPTMGGTWNSD